MRKTVSGLAALWIVAAAAYAAEPPPAAVPAPGADNQAVFAPATNHQGITATEVDNQAVMTPSTDNQAASPPMPETHAVPAPASDNQAVPAPAAAEEAPPAARPATAEGFTPKGPPVFISMDFTDVDLPVLVKFISEQTRKNFIFDERLQGKITIISPRKITVEEAYNVFLSVLQVKGFTTVEQGNTIKIVALRDAKQESLSTNKGGPDAPASEFITRLIPLQYVDTADVTALLAPIVSKDGLLTAFPASNTLILIDSRANIDRILKILAVIDVEGTSATLRIYPLTNAAAADIAKTLDVLYQQTPAAPQAGILRGRLGRSRGAASKFIPDSRTNSLIVLASGDMQDDIADLIAKLDIKAPENTGKINVYYLENADAEEVSKVLANLSERRGAPGQAPAPGAATVRGVITAELEGGVRITPDKATNSLIIIASVNDYQTLLDVIKKLDIRRRQVYVEALIMEITLNKGRDLGVEFRGAVETSNNGAAIGGTNFDFTGNINNLFTALATGNPLLFSGTGLIAGGIAGDVTLPDGTHVPAITAVLRAAQNRDNINILSSPHLLTLDNKEAEIIVGQNVPFITSQATPVTATNLSNVINTVERKDVGITLRLTPHIHESDFVNLDIYQESSAILGSSILNVNQVGPTTTKRSAKTSVLVKNKETVVLGGMMQDTTSVTEQQVPLLGDIPLLGNLFKFKSVSRQKTNLLIFLTPTIIKESQDLVGVTTTHQGKMETFIEQNRGEVEQILPEKTKK
ncbi:MAG TPA: type II secretion system secretin GspD [Candidatus Deferrimicrobiaceae bacterium]